MTEIEGNGDFVCPRCKTKISPDDETEAVYSILGSKVNSNGLEEVVIRCNKCSSHIHLAGFSLLQEMETGEELNERKKKAKRAIFLTYETVITSRIARGLFLIKLGSSPCSFPLFSLVSFVLSPLCCASTPILLKKYNSTNNKIKPTHKKQIKLREGQ